MPLPTTVTLCDPVTAALVIFNELTPPSPMSYVSIMDVVELRRLIVDVNDSKALTPVPALPRTLLDDTHKVDSTMLRPAPSDDEDGVPPSDAPTTVTLQLPVPAPLAILMLLTSAASKLVASESDPVEDRVVATTECHADVPALRSDDTLESDAHDVDIPNVPPIIACTLTSRVDPSTPTTVTLMLPVLPMFVITTELRSMVAISMLNNVD